MFTGIIESTALVIENRSGVLVLERPASFDDLKPGSSVAISGCCLTVTSIDEKTMQFEVVSETLSKTKLGSLKAGSRVNLERAMRADGRFDGHVVQGHVEGLGKMKNEELIINNEKLLSIVVPAELVRFVIPKGSITIDGVSLTVASIDGDVVSVAIIPETLRRTTLGELRDGDAVHIETDMIVRAVASLLPTQL